MAKYRILNLYACLGGNRYKWDEVSDNLEITAVELDPELARLYQERFPNDTVVIGDAHQYLLDHYKDFDFIWSSPPCPTHSRLKIGHKTKSTFIPEYPDIKLYQEIIFLRHFYDGAFLIENVIPYYTPLIPAQKRGRHLYWSSFKLPHNLRERKTNKGLMNGKGVVNEIEQWSVFHDYDFYKYKGEQRRDKIARNLVDYEAGRTILETALEIHRNRTTQTKLF